MQDQLRHTMCLNDRKRHEPAVHLAVWPHDYRGLPAFAFVLHGWQ